MSVSSSTGVLILGGGIAGLTAALRLAEHGLPVTVLESAPAVGGRVRSWLDDRGERAGNTSHLVPGWHINFRALLDQIGRPGLLRDHGGSAVFTRSRGLSRLTSLPLPRLLSPLTNRLASYREFSSREKASAQSLAMLLASYHSDRLELLDEISLRAWGVGFNASIQPFLRHLLEPYTLHTLTTSGHDISARTASAVTRRHIDCPSPFVSSLEEPLQKALIEPLVDLLRHKGVVIRTNTAVTGLVAGRNRLDAVLAGDLRFEAAHFISALPVERLRPLLTPELLRFHYFRDLSRLRTHPLASLELHFKIKLMDLEEPLIYSDSELGLYCRNVGQPQKARPDSGTVLNCVLTRYESFSRLTDAELVGMVLRELQVIFPQLRPEWLEHYSLQRNDETPDFLHVIGSWRYRPRTRSPLPNFLLAGDWIRHPIDLACLEGAAVSGKLAANAVLEDRHLEPDAVLEVSDPIQVRTLSAAADLLEWPRRQARRLMARADRRRDGRVESAMEGYLEDIETHLGWSQVLILNLAERGVFFVSEASPRVGARVRLRVRTHRGEQIELRGRVVRVEEVRDVHGAAIGVGCRVSPLDSDSETLWNSLTHPS